ncbi:hypothetical protein A6B43_02795 [Vespertiliibacter pulmonis]|uniref:DUF2322 family protein n=1 Tax=Vespertiliibacter pulmonis TaxID=1443036 RepID=A0A3N4VU19_9PAST|nr:DUF2322 family protein [Vespertiliibacter pulmonis]QLB20533.1 hypothetical protein A6B43_02795 [Vespertiliibacter pulmonis]RPE82661.1 hypothetical protein EDC46_1330 [Vespertiliibacter pulmonis]
MQFKDYLASFPDISSLAGIDVLDEKGEVIHHIPAIEGKLGSLKLYNALLEQFDHQLNEEAAQQGLIWFAEHVDDAKQNAGKHPNIDLLFKVLEHHYQWQLKALHK